LRHLEGNALFRDGFFGAQNPLGDSGFGHQKRTGDFGSGQPTQQAERQRHPPLGGKHGVAGGEDQAKEIITDIVVHGRIQICGGHRLLRFQIASEFLVLLADALIAPHDVDGAVFRGGQQPGSRVQRDARLRPLFERRHQGVLRQFFRNRPIAHDVRENAGDAPRFDMPYGFDGPADIGLEGGSGHLLPRYSRHRRTTKTSRPPHVIPGAS